MVFLVDMWLNGQVIVILSASGIRYIAARLYACKKKILVKDQAERRKKREETGDVKRMPWNGGIKRYFVYRLIRSADIKALS